MRNHPAGTKTIDSPGALVEARGGFVAAPAWRITIRKVARKKRVVLIWPAKTMDICC
jgi:hypothetical protein